MNLIEPRVQLALDAAMSMIKTAASSAAVRVAESLENVERNSALAAGREQVFNALHDLRRNMGTFQVAFHTALRVTPSALARSSPE